MYTGHLIFIISMATVALCQDSGTDRSKNSINPGGSSSSSSINTEDELKSRLSKKSTARNRGAKRGSKKPNIVVILTDDQDTELGSLNFMPKTMRILRDGGAMFTNAFVTTPMCCPSRSSFLTGMYVHNHNTYTNNDNCSSIQWQQKYETRNFGTYLSNAGYRTGYFGKYLNQYNGSYIPPGWREWVGLIRNSRFYNYSLNFNGRKIKHEDNYYQDYLTDLIANDSVTFLKKSKQYFPNRPIAMVLSTPAPHGPEDSAPQYQHMFKNITTHRTVSWNYAPNPDKQWLLRQTDKLQPIEKSFTDILHTKRLQTLQSVDDAVEKVYFELKNLGELRNTYIIYTSDHGYHLGQFGLIKGKAMPYEFDIRVPFLVRGPAIPHRIKIPNIVLNIDVAPTLLDIAGVTVPEHMDGRSILPLLEYAKDPYNNYRGLINRKKAWRDSFLVERGKITNRKIMWRERVEAEKNNLLTPKEMKIKHQCAKEDYKLPCNEGQKWYCADDDEGGLFLAKCRNRKGMKPIPSSPSEETATRKCKCPKDGYKIPRREKKHQRRFLRDHVTDDYQPQFLRRGKRSSSTNQKQAFFRTLGISDDLGPTDIRKKRALPWQPGGSWGITLHDADRALYGKDDGHILKKCQVLANNSVVCQPEVYDSVDSWKSHKQELTAIIEQYKRRLDSLKGIRRHLKRQRPAIHHSATSTTTSTTTTIQPSTLPMTSTKDSIVVNVTSIWEDPDVTIDNVDSSSIDDVSVIDVDSEGSGEISNAIEDNLIATDDAEKTTVATDGDAGNEDDEELCDCDDLIDNEIRSEDLRTKQRLERLEERRARRKERRQRKQSRGQRKRDRTRPKDVKSCNPVNENCADKPRTVKKNKKWTPRKDPMCYRPGLQCQRMDNDHWRTAPHWTLGPFCFCPNSNNNTYWCLRTINQTHNFLYCEYISGFLSYYDLIKDPYELRNAIHDLGYGLIHQMAEKLHKLQSCRGARECTVRTRQRDSHRWYRKRGVGYTDAARR